VINKEFSEWSGDDLVAWAAWRVVEGITAGIAIKTIMHEILMSATKWKPPAKKGKKP